MRFLEIVHLPYANQGFPVFWGYGGTGNSVNLYINRQFSAYAEGTSDNIITVHSLVIQFVLLGILYNLTPKNIYFKVFKVKYLFCIPTYLGVTKNPPVFAGIAILVLCRGLSQPSHFNFLEEFPERYVNCSFQDTERFVLL